MLYTIYLDEKEGATKDEPPVFDAIFSGSITFLSEEYVKIGCGIRVIPVYDHLRIVEIMDVLEEAVAPSWNGNRGRIATGREMTAQVIRKSQYCFLLEVRSHTYPNVHQKNEGGQ